MRVYAPFLSDFDKYNDITKAAMSSADLIAEYSKESANLAKILLEATMIYEYAEESALEISLALTNNVNLKEEKYARIYQENIYNNFTGQNFDIITKKISSNELVLPDWLSEAVIKFNMFYEQNEQI